MGLLSGLLNRTSRTARGGARGGSPLGTGTGGTIGRSGVGRAGVGSLLSRLTRGRRSL